MNTVWDFTIITEKVVAPVRKIKGYGWDANKGLYKIEPDYLTITKEIVEGFDGKHENAGE